MSLIGRILNASNAFQNVTNLAGGQSNPGGSELTIIPLGTLGASATGELAVKVLVVGSSSGGGSGTLIVTGPVSTTATGSSVSVTATSGSVLAANANRKYAAICNIGTNDVTIFRGATVVSGSGITLKSGGGSYEINSTNLYLGAISCICAATLTSTLSVEEDT